MAKLIAADFTKVKDDTSALCANMSNNLKIDLIPLHSTVQIFAFLNINFHSSKHICKTAFTRP